MKKEVIMKKLIAEIKNLAEKIDPDYFQNGSEDIFSDESLNNTDVNAIYNIYKKEGFYKFKLSDPMVYDFEEFLKQKGEVYQDTSQLGTDITIFDPNSNNIPLRWKK